MEKQTTEWGGATSVTDDANRRDAREWDAGYDQAVREVLSEVASHDKELAERIQYRFPEWAKVMRRAKRS